jgi:hypothetical protein
VGWIHLAQDMEQWWACVNTIMNSGIPQKAGNFLTSSVTLLHEIIIRYLIKKWIHLHDLVLS